MLSGVTQAVAGTVEVVEAVPVVGPVVQAIIPPSSNNGGGSGGGSGGGGGGGESLMLVFLLCFRGY